MNKLPPRFHFPARECGCALFWRQNILNLCDLSVLLFKFIPGYRLNAAAESRRLVVIAVLNLRHSPGSLRAENPAASAGITGRVGLRPAV